MDLEQSHCPRYRAISTSGLLSYSIRYVDKENSESVLAAPKTTKWSQSARLPLVFDVVHQCGETHRGARDKDVGKSGRIIYSEGFYSQSDLTMSLRRSTKMGMVGAGE